MAQHAYGYPGILEHADEEELRHDGYVLEVNRQFFHPLGLELVLQIAEDGLRFRVDDHRTLQAAVVYAPQPEGGESRLRKVARIGNLWEMKAQARLARYGWVIQPPEIL